MENESPPKRVTRSRAAAKTTEPGPPKMKIATAATKVKATRAGTTTSTKRKTRADDTHDDDEQTHEEEEHEDEPMEKKKVEPTKTTRGRAKKPAQEEPESATQKAADKAPTTRGRPKKTVVEAPQPEPTRTTRGRPKKVDTVVEGSKVPEPDVASASEPVTKSTRSGRIAATKPATTTKKSVTFEEKHDLDKENKLPTRAVRGKAKVAEEPTGLRAKPLRRPASAAAPRATRGRAKTVTEPEPEQPEIPAQKSSPLSPKKVKQIATAKGPASDDELSTMYKTPMKSLTRSPVKAPGSIMDPAKRLDFTTSITVNRLTTDLNASLLSSPARKVPQSAHLDMSSPVRKASQPEFKDTMKESPRKFNLSDSMVHAPFKAVPGSLPSRSPFKASLLQSPARRPPSPTKAFDSENGSSTTIAATPKVSQFKISRFATPKTTSKSVFGNVRPAGGSIIRPNTASASRFNTADSSRTLDFPSASFPGRLSAIVPRDVDPDISPAKVPTANAEEVSEKASETIEEELPSTEDACEEAPRQEEPVEEDPMLAPVTEDYKDEIALFQSSTRSTTPPSPPPFANNPLFELRPEVVDPFQDSDSEDELSSTSKKYSPIPLSAQKMPQTPNAFSGHMADFSRSSRTGTTRTQRQQIGFTPLARQLSEWMGASPEKPDEVSDYSTSEPSPFKEAESRAEESPSKGGFFHDEMLVRENENMIEDAMDVDGEVVMDEVELVDEDVALAAEADEMSLHGPVEVENSKIEDMLKTEEEVDVPAEENDVVVTRKRSISDCSQDYGDENDMPIDPALLSFDAQPHTPQQRPYFERVSHTVTKVPLKPAAEDSPIKFSPMKRSASVSRIPAKRGDASAGISFSLNKSAMKSRQDQPLEEILDEITTPRPSKVAAPQTPWSSAVTPARTPRRDLNDQLLKGAVVYVDVHTTEGADASGIFVELLTQMGAKCVKTWTWNPNHSSPESDGNSTNNKIGITHVVFKDGGKRTLEKVRESNGIVLCIGVGWVLDCERENQWLDESLYAVDTSLIPRGGHRRRKSMEPRALANLNGTLVPISPTKEFLNLETPKFSNQRRASREWVRSPSHSSPEELAALEAMEEDLLPVPATPAPISAYSESLLDDEDGEATPYFLHPKDLVQMTCPPKKTGKEYEGGGGVYKGDGGVMARLMMARRKSLQFAPKVGSPLAKGNWEA